MYIMGTGSRSMVRAKDRREIYSLLEKKVLQMAEADPDIHLISGMAEGWDEAIAKVGMRNSIPYTVYIPHPTYGSYYWGRHSVTGKNRLATFNTLVEGAAAVHTCCQNLYEYVDGERLHANFIRNIEMVKAADHALVYMPQSTGTRHCVGILTATHTPFETYPFIEQLSMEL